jgi:outer membrane protein assembly factor BamB
LPSVKITPSVRPAGRESHLIVLHEGITMSRLLAAFSLSLLLLGTTRADNWPQWRGPQNDGICNEKDLPIEWSADKNVLWKLKMPGSAGATPAIWGDKIFLSSADDNKNVVVLCVSTAGKELWRHPLGKDFAARGSEGNGASPSPCTDGKLVYFFVGSGEMAAYDFDGKEVWKFNCQERYGKFKIQFGMHSTPVLHGDRLYFQLIHSGGAWVVCVDKSTGKDVWKVQRKSDGTDENEHSYASPVMWQNGKEAYLVTHGNDYAIAHKLEDGSEIWRVGGLNPRTKYRRDLRFVTSPAVSPDLIVVPSAKNHGVVGVKPSATGSVMPGSTHEVWRLTKDTPDVPSPVIQDGLVYLCKENGSLLCLDSKSGAAVYEKKMHNGLYRASPVLADGKLYCTCRDGVITVVKAGKTFEKLAENKLPDQTTASPAISNGRIYIRGFDTLWAIGAK